jgi:hypothetical protein
MTKPDNVLKPPTDPGEVRLAELEAQLRQRDALIEQLQHGSLPALTQPPECSKMFSIAQRRSEFPAR